MTTMEERNLAIENERRMMLVLLRTYRELLKEIIDEPGPLSLEQTMKYSAAEEMADRILGE